jgi:PAS domain-containing protein
MDIFVALAKACDGPWDLVVMLLVTLGTSPLLLLIGSMSGDLTASRMLFSVTRSSWIVSSFSICSLLIYRLERASGLEQLGLSVAPLSEADAYVSTIAISMFAAVILADIVLIILWPEMLRTNRSVVAGATINCIACSACMLKLSGPELFCDDFTGRKLSIGRYIVWNHTIALMCVLLNNLTTVSNQQACWRVFLSQMVIQAGFAGSVAMGSIPLNCAFLAISQYALTRVCVLLFHSLREAKSFAWQRSILGIFVFTTWHCFPIIWVFVALDFVDASGEFRLYAIADVLSKTLITTTMLQGHVKVESDKLVSEFNVVTAERKMMQDDLYELIHSAAVPIIVTNAKGQVTVWNRVVAETSHIPPHAAEGCAMWELPHLTPSAAAGAKAALSQILAETDSESEPCASITFELTFQARGDSINSDNESDSARSEPQVRRARRAPARQSARRDMARHSASLRPVSREPCPRRT